MGPLAESKPIRVVLDGEDGATVYIVKRSAPSTGAVQHSYDVAGQLETDGHSAEQLGILISDWARSQSDVDLVTLKLSGQTYWLNILTTTTDADRLLELQLSFDTIRRRFGDFRPFTSFVGPEQRNSSIVAAKDVKTIYHRREKAA